MLIVTTILKKIVTKCIATNTKCANITDSFQIEKGETVCLCEVVWVCTLYVWILLNMAFCLRNCFQTNATPVCTCDYGRHYHQKTSVKSFSYQFPFPPCSCSSVERWTIHATNTKYMHNTTWQLLCSHSKLTQNSPSSPTDSVTCSVVHM